MQTIINILLLLLNVFAYTFSFIYYRERRKSFDAGAFALFLCMIISILGAVSFFFSTGQYFKYLPQIRLLPFIYLYVMLLLAMAPLLSFNSSKTDIVRPNKVSISVVCIFCGVLAILQLPELFVKGTQALYKTLFTSEGAHDLYRRKMMLSVLQGHGISNVIAILNNAVTDIAILLLAFLFVEKKIKTRYAVYLLLSIGCTMIRKVIDGERAGLALILISFICAFLLTKEWIPKEKFKKVKKIVLIGTIAICVPVVAITASRFNKRNGAGEQSPLASTLWYTGQPMIFFNNFGLDAGGVRNGDKTALLLKKALGYDVPMNYVERRDKYSNLKVDDFIFYTFVGDFTLDYGPKVAFCLFFFFSLLCCLVTRPHGGKIRFHQLILIYCCANVCCQGVIYLYSYADIGGNIKIVTYFLFYIFFYLNSKKSKYEESDSSGIVSASISSDTGE